MKSRSFRCIDKPISNLCIFYNDKIAIQGPSESQAAKTPSRETPHLPESEPSQDKVGPNIFPSPYDMLTTSGQITKEEAG